MAQVKDARTLRRVGLILALLCPVTWLYTGWHLAVETHHDHAISAVSAVDDHDHDRHHDADHHDGDYHDAPVDDEGHHHGDHLIPDSLRPEHAPVFAFDLEPLDVVLDGWDLAATPTATAAPCEDVPPATDPPIESLQPRAPPVG